MKKWGTRLPLSLMQELLAACPFHLVFHYLLFQKHSKHNVFNPFRTNAPVMFCVFPIFALFCIGTKRYISYSHLYVYIYVCTLCVFVYCKVGYKSTLSKEQINKISLGHLGTIHEGTLPRNGGAEVTKRTSKSDLGVWV